MKSSIKKYFFISVLLYPNYLTYSQNVWQEISILDSVGSINFLEFDENGVLYAAGSGLFYSLDKGVSWEKIEKQEFSNQIINCILVLPDDVIFIGVNQNGIYKSTNAGKEWINLGLKLIYIDCIIKDYENNIYVGTSEQVYKSTDYGLNWTRLNNGFSQNLEVWSLYVTKQRNILAGTNCGLYSSSDGGENWTFIRSFDCGDITQIIGVNNDEYIFIGGADRFRGLCFSIDGGYTWNVVLNSDSLTWATSIIPSKTNEVYTSSRFNGVYKYNITNSTFSNFNSGIDYAGINSMAMDSLGYLYAASNKIYKSRLPVDSIKYNNNIHYNFALKQNYPNPFNSITNITYDLPLAAGVNLNIYDVLGNKMAEIMYDLQTKGEHSIKIDASNWPSGVYFYNLKSGEISKTKKMILLR